MQTKRKRKRQIRPWSLEALIKREKVFDGLVSKAVKMTLQPLAMNASGLLTAAVEAELSLSDSLVTSMLGPTVSMDAAGAIAVTWDRFVDRELLPFLKDTFLDGAAQAHMGLPADTPIVADFIADDYLTTASNNLRNISDLVWMSIRSELSEGVAAGEDMSQLSGRVRAASQVSAGRAMTIARTEVHRAAEAGSMAQMTLSGFTSIECSKKWLATEDERTRLAHIQADGQTVGLHEAFNVGGEWLQYPGDPLGRADNVINCRCTMTYLFDDEEDEDELTASSVPSQIWYTFHLPGRHDQSTHGRRGGISSPSKAAASKVPVRKQTVSKGSTDVITGSAALAVPPRNLELMTASNDPRADALWYRTGDNSLETESGQPGSFEMSAQMRGQEKMTAKIKDHVKAIDAVMGESQLPEPILVYRGAERLGGVRPDEAIGEGRNLVGREFTDKAFVSVTTDATHAAWFGGTVLRIRVPKDTSAIRMADRKGTERDQQESEILLDRNLTYRIVAQYGRGELEGDWGEAYVLDVEVVR